jgi:hypothetical protein
LGAFSRINRKIVFEKALKSQYKTMLEFEPKASKTEAKM